MRNFSHILKPATFRFCGIIMVVCGLLIFSALSTMALDRATVKDSVVKIYVTQNRPDYDVPWNLTAPETVSGSGCVIRGNRILTNAHVVSDQTFVQVRLHGRPDRAILMGSPDPRGGIEARPPAPQELF